MFSDNDGPSQAEYLDHMVKQKQEQILGLRAMLRDSLQAWKVLKAALEDIASADETSTLEGAVAIAKAALKEGA